MFKKILIANRGEIACRVAATARKLSVQTVAVFSKADAHAKHVAACDEAVYVGEGEGNSPKESYLRWQAILAAAKATGAQAVHPGYGFLSENESLRRPAATRGWCSLARTFGDQGNGLEGGVQAAHGKSGRAAGARLSRRQPR